MKILIIGGSGVISTAVAQALIDRGEKPTLLNRGQTLVRLRGNFDHMTADRTDRRAFENVVRQSGSWDAVVDMICSDPDDAASLARVLRGRAAQLVFCSTTNVYPKPADTYPVPEDHRLGAAYKNGIDKARCEGIHRDAETAGEYRLTVIRPGQTFGETGGVLNSLASPAFVDRLRRGRPIVVHGDGNGLWSALHADDVAQVFAAATGNPLAFGRTYNATGTDWMTWDRYYLGIAEALGVAPPEWVHIPSEVLARLCPARAAQCKRSLQYPGIYDMTSARDELGFRARIPFVAGMRRVIDWLDAHGCVEPWESDPDYDRAIHDWKHCIEKITPGNDIQPKEAS